ncbi:ccch zinc finger and rrm domain-containing protein [Pyrenophora tritici-repentis]|nr:ccch zinc finger and rrm domain-containing protein [Pyrenophora tritici-repentis]
MLLPETDHAVFKRWLLPKLETISDAEAGVLADYVVALVATDDTEANIQRSCIESLEDFLGGENTAAFVKDVIAALKEKAYLPKPTANAPIKSIVGSANFEYEPHPSNVPSDTPRGPAATRNQTGHRLPDRPTAQGIQDGSNQSRKRKVLEGDHGHSWEAQDPHYNRNGTGNRPVKQAARRGGRNAMLGGMEPHNTFTGFASMPNFVTLPAPPPGPLPFDPTDPMALFAMAAVFGANLPGMPPLPFSNEGNSRKTKCIKYHENGYCAIGKLCPYEHDDAAVEVPEYDPEQSHLAVKPNGSKARGQHRSTRGGKARTKFPPSHDPSNTTLVVDHIPEPNCNEESVRSYFSEFGSILEVEMHADKHLAIVKFADRPAAKRAKNSPKAVFENRFVKVYWHTPEVDEELAKETEKLDLEAIAIKQAEAQKAFEERRRKTEEAAARAAEIDRQLKEKNEEIEEIKRQLAELSGEVTDDFAQTLETLQKEAAELFNKHDAYESSARGRGRGVYRGAYRGHGFAPSRGGYRSRGRGFTAFGGSAVKRLDNRPRRLAVSDIEANTSRDEALRQHLLNNPGCTTIERHPEEPNALILTFKERYQAEMFLDESLSIPDVGKLELAWISNDAFGGLGASTTTPTENEPASESTDIKCEDDGDDDDSSATVGEAEGHAGQQVVRLLA